MAGLIADLHQVDAALYRRCDQARSQAVPAKGRRVKAKLGGGSLYHAGDVAGSQSLIPYPLGPPIENAPKDSPFADTGRLEPSLERRHGTDSRMVPAVTSSIVIKCRLLEGLGLND